MKRIRIKMAEYMVSNGAILVTTVGSCVAIGLFDGQGVGGLAHIMLPEHNGKGSVGKYAETAIPAMLDDMVRKNADAKKIKAKIAGGAKMFGFPSLNFAIGERNVKKVKEILENLGIRIVGEEVGKNYGRTVEFFTSTGKMVIKRSNEVLVEL
jgi:chemotaxis protein CheD